MGTRSTTTFHSEWNDKPLVTIYQQYDGYIEGVGHKLAEFLNGKTVINGIGSKQSMETGFANGMGCLAAQYIAAKKTRIGGFYLTTEGDSQDFNYHVKLVDGKIQIEVDCFTGSPSELLTLIQKTQEGDR